MEKNMLLSKNYDTNVVEIGGFVTIWEDNYENGEVRYGINEWNLEEKRIILKSKLNKKTLKEIKYHLFEAMNDILYKKLTIRKFKNIDIFKNRICYTQYTNESNDWAPSREDFKAWERGDKNLYVQDINITLKINGEDVSEEDLEKIINL